MKKFKQFVAELMVRDPSGKPIQIKKQVYRGADMKLHKDFPGKSSSSGGGGNGS